MNNAQHIIQKALSDCNSTDLYIKVVHMKPVLGLIWMMEQGFLHSLHGP
jgi:hypothetical protein